MPPARPVARGHPEAVAGVEDALLQVGIGRERAASLAARGQGPRSPSCRPAAARTNRLLLLRHEAAVDVDGGSTRRRSRTASAPRSRGRRRALLRLVERGEDPHLARRLVLAAEAACAGIRWRRETPPDRRLGADPVRRKSSGRPSGARRPRDQIFLPGEAAHLPVAERDEHGERGEREQRRHERAREDGEPRPHSVAAMDAALFRLVMILSAISTPFSGRSMPSDRTSTSGTHKHEMHPERRAERGLRRRARRRRR